LVIYIYGSESFKKDIHAVLNHSNIKFRLDEHGEIKDLDSVVELKEAIEDNPNNIYLIDDAKIIKKNSINQKIKFLQAKDSIEQEYLLDNGIGDISVDSIEELAIHIKRRLESVINEKESSEIQESIVEMVENAYEEEDDDNKEYIQLDEELSQLLSNNHPEEEEEDDDYEENDYMSEISDDIKKDSVLEDAVSLIDDIENIEDIDKDDASLLKDLSFDKDLDNIKTNNETVEEKTIESDIDIEDTMQGDKNMVDEFSQFDTLNEDEILAALDGMNNIDTSAPSTLKESLDTSTKPTNEENVKVNSSNVNDIAQLISSLLNNKTLEITIKVKD